MCVNGHALLRTLEPNWYPSYAVTFFNKEWLNSTGPPIVHSLHCNIIGLLDFVMKNGYLLQKLKFPEHVSGAIDKQYIHPGVPRLD